MATLQLHWDRTHTYDLWSWSMGSVHQTARILRCIKNGVYCAHIGPRGMEPTQIIIIKAAWGEDELVGLNREVAVYENELRHLQGIAVPRCFGYFRGKVKGMPLGCLLLEYCSGPFRYLQEFQEQAIAVTCKIHEAGLEHGDLLDGRHFIKMGDGVRVIDFSTAIRHHSKSTSPYCMDKLSTCCVEIDRLREVYGAVESNSGRRHLSQGVHLYC